MSSEEQPIEIVRYEAKWFTHTEWEECTKKDYHDIISCARDGDRYPDGTGPQARALAVVTDEGGLLLEGPKGFKSWREAAVNEKMRRIDLEHELEALKNGKG